jgi:hypothetical protein
MWIRVCASAILEYVLGVCYQLPKLKDEASYLVDMIRQDIEAINMQSSTAVMMLTGDLN